MSSISRVALDAADGRDGRRARSERRGQVDAAACARRTARRSSAATSRSTASPSTSPATDTFVVPERRSVGVVFQDYLLFPHLSVLENVAFGLRSRGVGRADARRRAQRVARRASGCGDRAGAKPAALSGGQQQRVALRARARDRAAAAAARRAARRARRRARAPSCAATCARISPRSPGPGCSSPTSCSTRSRSPIGSSCSEHGRVAQSGTVAEVAGRATLALRRRPRRHQPAPRRRARARRSRIDERRDGGHRGPGRGRRVRRDPAALGEPAP